jgi:hypothetical protein
MTSAKRIVSVMAAAVVAMGILGLTVGSAGAAPITIVYGDFGPIAPDSNEVPHWDEGGASYFRSNAENGGYLYCDAGGGIGDGWVAQDLDYNWTAGEVFTVGIRGNQGWRAGGSFKIQLREADTTLLWESGATPVTATDTAFTWTVDSSTDFVGGTPGRQLNIRIECLSATVYLDDVTLSTDLADTTAPTLASSDIVDDKSGGPVNPGELVTYTVTFSETMDDGTVSLSDFDNAGTATVLFGTLTSLDAGVYSIPVVAASTGTLQLRVPVGATLTDLAGNPFDASSAILDDTTINVVAKVIGVTGGDFEDPYTNDQPADIPEWFDSTVQYADWHNAARYTSSGSQSAFLQFYSSSHGYMYQSLGQLEAGTTSLDWSFDQVRTATGAGGSADMRFFYGVSPSAGEGTDIDTLGFTQIGGTNSIPTISGSDTNRTGSLDVSSVSAGSTIWVDFTHTDGSFLLDNISVTATKAAGTVFVLE